MRRIAVWRKILLVLLGTGLCFIALEGGLRLGGFMLTMIQQVQNRIKLAQKKDYVILCLGESTTQRQWPSWLAGELERLAPDLRITVIDEGVTATSSYHIANRFPSLLDRYHPDIVTVMMGINDTIHAPPTSRGREQLEEIRIIRLLRLLGAHIRARLRAEGLEAQLKQIASMPQSQKNGIGKTSFSGEDEARRLAHKADHLYEQGDIAGALEHCMQAYALDAENEDYFQQILKYYYFLPDGRTEMLAFLHKKLAQDPHHGGAINNIARDHIQQKKYKEAAEILQNELQQHFDPRKVVELVQVYMIQGDIDAYERLNAQARQAGIVFSLDSQAAALRRRALAYQLRGDEINAKYYFEAARDFRLAHPKERVISNYNYIKRLTQKQGIQLVCVEYPTRSVEPLQRMFQPHADVIFVDNEIIFKEVLRTTADYKDYFVDNFGGSFGHCTQKGNRLLAKNIAGVLLREYFIKQGRWRSTE